ncbi:MAG: hypothetical protein AAF487_07745 [Bacteroidota bacterium]
MRKLLLLFALSFFATEFFGQFKVGVNGGYLNTWLINRNLSDAGDNVDPLATFSPTYGANFIYVFNESVGISTGVSLTTIAQQTDGVILEEMYEAETKLFQTNVPIALRLENEGGTYFEVGPLFSFLSKAEESFDAADNGLFTDYTDQDFTPDFTSFNLSAMAGFGVLVDLSDQLQMSAGLELSYGFTDSTTEYTEAQAFDLDEQSLYNSIAHTTQQGDFAYESSNQAYIGIKIGILYVAGTN